MTAVAQMMPMASSASNRTYAILNPADKTALCTLSNGNLRATFLGQGMVRCNQAKTSGQWFFEVKYISGSGFAIGAADSTASINGYPADGSSDDLGWSSPSDYLYTLIFSQYGYFAGSPIGRAPIPGDVIGCRITPNNDIGFFINGIYVSGQSTSTPTSYACIGSTGNGSPVLEVNFGATPFVYNYGSLSGWWI